MRCYNVDEPSYQNYTMMFDTKYIIGSNFLFCKMLSHRICLCRFDELYCRSRLENRISEILFNDEPLYNAMIM
jgi:hypothetical protein